MNKPHFIQARKMFQFVIAIITAISLLFTTLAFSISPVRALQTTYSAPELLSPDDSVIVTATNEGTISAPPLAVPVFTWASVTGATQYQIRFSQDPNFSTAIAYVTGNTFYIPTSVNSFNDGEWYWQVKVTKPLASEFSPSRSFTKNWGSDNNAPQLLAPVDFATVEFFEDTIFRWTPVIGAASYIIRVSPDPNFPTTNLKINIETLATKYQPNVFLDNGLYYWQVIPVDTGKHQGKVSATYSFQMGYNEVPVLIEPANHSNPTFTPTFRWTAVRGALDYELQYSTDSTFNSSLTKVTTKNTTYTPRTPLPNDRNYYWRVRAYNGKSFSDWSNQNEPMPWYFIKRWYIQPVLLTPIATFPYVRFPFFSWTPVPGASNYRVEVDTTPSFTSPDLDEYTENPFYTPRRYDGTPGIRYWRVTPYDSANNAGKASVVGQFTSYSRYSSPDLVWPLYYYPTNTYPAPDENVAMNPYEDRSVAYPLFIWQRLFIRIEDYTVLPGAYRLDVGKSMKPDGTVNEIVWSIETENLYATPKNNEFTPVQGQIYYWQVTPLSGLGGTQIYEFSQVWKTRFDNAKGLPVSSSPVPQLLRPAYKQSYNPAVDPGYDSPEFVEITPALEWFPMNGATQYQVDVSRTEDFSTIIDTATVKQPVYAPRTSFGQRSLSHLGFGSYYWRVRAYVGGGWTNWSNVWRFEIASQSQWREARSLGNELNRLEIARDPGDGQVVQADYDLNRLFASQDMDYWYFGFDYAGNGTSTYVIYLDRDNRNNSGATTDFRGYPIVSNTAHYPEYAIYIDKINGSLSAANVLIYAWNATTGWDTGFNLAYIGGDLSADGSHLEIKVPYQTIGMQLETGTYSLALLSVDSAIGMIKDVVPDNTITSGSVNLKNITTVSEHLSLISPASDLGGDPTSLPAFPPFFWNSPYNSPWAGYTIKFYLDSQFSKEAGTFTITSDTAFYSPTSIVWPNDIGGDNTYYWRIRPRYLTAGVQQFGSWSQAFRFERQGFEAQNLQVSVLEATPTFRWDRVEGAHSYRLSVSQDPNFSSTSIDVTTTEPSYTPQNSLANGTYYWRVRVTRKNNETASWTMADTFNLNLPRPSILSPNNTTVTGTPTFCWNVPVVTDGVHPVLFPTKYRLLISKGDPNFSTPYETVTTNQNCYTPTKGYADDGNYYWKVAIYDGDGHLGAYSEPANFQKVYPIAKPLSPVNGEQSPVTPIFRWTAQDGTSPFIYGAASYRIEVSLSPTFTTLYDSMTTDFTTYTPTKVYASNKIYYWRVAMRDKNGNVGPYTHTSVLIDKPKVFLPFVRK